MVRYPKVQILTIAELSLVHIRRCRPRTCRTCKLSGTRSLTRPCPAFEFKLTHYHDLPVTPVAAVKVSSSLADTGLIMV